MKAKELKEQSPAELQKGLIEARAELLQLRLRGQQAGGKLEKPHRVQEIRKNIARMCTLMREKQN